MFVLQRMASFGQLGYLHYVKVYYSIKHHTFQFCPDYVS